MSDEIPVINTGQLVVRYTRALTRWIKAGRPVREEKVIEEIFEQYCTPCEAFESFSSSCRHCGCRVNKSSIAPFNKIAMGTEECPLEKWK